MTIQAEKVEQARRRIHEFTDLQFDKLLVEDTPQESGQQVELDDELCRLAARVILAHGRVPSQGALGRYMGLERNVRERAGTDLDRPEANRRRTDWAGKIAYTLEAQGMVERSPRRGNDPRAIWLTPRGEAWALGEV
jgi:hypothetical protein